MGDRLASWKKKLTKENMAILALLGILLMVIALPVKKTENAGDETGLSDTGSDTMKTSETEKDDGDGSYTQEVENRLEALLSSMDGVGEVKVMVTLSSSVEQVVEKRRPLQHGYYQGNGQCRRQPGCGEFQTGGNHRVCDRPGRQQNALYQ